jgi:hypothetical protein
MRHPNQKPLQAPPRRNIGTECLLYEAIRRQRLIELRFKGEKVTQTVAPYAVFLTEKHGVCLSCHLLSSLEEPKARYQLRSRMVADVQELRLTDRPFSVDPRFDPDDVRYDFGVLCMVDGA